MCLSSVTKSINSEGIGYKVYFKQQNYYLNYGQYSIGIKYYSDKKEILAYDGNKYVAGFHIFTNLSDAVSLYHRLSCIYPHPEIVIVRVSYHAHTIGIENKAEVSNAEVVIADSMTILEEVSL